MNTEFFTRKGDNGESCIGGKGVRKSSRYARAIGALDETTSWLGYCRSVIEDEFVSRTVRDIQEVLFTAQAEVVSLGTDFDSGKRVSEDKIRFLEEIVEKVDREIPPIRNFIIPGGSRESATLDFGRALVRRAERELVEFGSEADVSADLLGFMNRLSSTLFALARYMNLLKGIKEESPSYK